MGQKGCFWETAEAANILKGKAGLMFVGKYNLGGKCVIFDQATAIKKLTQGNLATENGNVLQKS